MSLQEVLYILFLIYFIGYWPVYGYFEYKKFERELKSGATTKSKYYRMTMIELWIPTFIVILLVFFTSLAFRDIGISTIEIREAQLHPWLTYLLLAIGIIIVLSTVYQSIALKLSAQFRNKYKEKLKQSKLPEGLMIMMPATRKEKCLWTGVSMTAGITEEILYRGLLIYILDSFLPQVPIIALGVIASLIFGLGHSYQGIGGIAKTALTGFFFSLLYIGIGSIIPGMVIHAVIDYAANHYTIGVHEDTEGKEIKA